MRAKLEALATEYENAAKGLRQQADLTIQPHKHLRAAERAATFALCASDLRALLSESPTVSGADSPKCWCDKQGVEAYVDRADKENGACMACRKPVRLLWAHTIIGQLSESPERVRMEPQPDKRVNDGNGWKRLDDSPLVWFWHQGFYRATRTAPSPAHRPVLADGVWWWEVANESR